MTQPPCDLTEDHEKYAGEVIPDPWDDLEQTDWPMNPEGGGLHGVGTDKVADTPSQ